jgi:hypothetical protein
MDSIRAQIKFNTRVRIAYPSVIHLFAKTSMGSIRNQFRICKGLNKGLMILFA